MRKHQRRDDLASQTGQVLVVPEGQQGTGVLSAPQRNGASDAAATILTGAQRFKQPDMPSCKRYC